VLLDGPAPVHRRAELHSFSGSRDPSRVIIGVLENEGIMTLRNVCKYCHISGHLNLQEHRWDNPNCFDFVKRLKKEIILYPLASGLMVAVWKAPLCEDTFQWQGTSCLCEDAFQQQVTSSLLIKGRERFFSSARVRHDQRV